MLVKNFVYESFDYKLNINKDEDIKLVFPCCNCYHPKSKQNTVTVTNKININIFVNSTVDFNHEIKFACNSKKSKLVLCGVNKLISNIQLIHCYTLDCGYNWFIEFVLQEDNSSIITLALATANTALDNSNKNTDAITAIESNIEDDIKPAINTLEQNENIIVSHVSNVENSVFWIDKTTLESTRESVDPDTLTPLPTNNK